MAMTKLQLDRWGKHPKDWSAITMEQIAVPESLGETDLPSQPGGGGGDGGLGYLFIIDLYLKLHNRDLFEMGWELFYGLICGQFL